MKITLLGTSSAVPTAQRNVSALAISFDREWLLFDCGEGTQRQIAAAGLKTGRLERIFITHLHGDHVIGLLALVGTLGLFNRERPLGVYGPPGLRELLSTAERLRLFQSNFDVVVEELDFAGPVCTGHGYAVHCAPLDHRIVDYGYRVVENDRPGRFSIERAEQLNIPPGPLYGQLQRGASITRADGRIILPEEVMDPSRPGRRVAYCTDTQPCHNAVELARDVDVLVHEATYANDELEMAGARGHSTAQQAAEIALAANARRLVLTHFSSRYTSLETLLAEAQTIFPASEIGHDLMEIEL